MTKPLVSIIIAAYNYGKYISETLQSVENQTYTNWECIIIDDGSADDTREVVKPFIEKDGRFQYHYQENKGLPATRNVAIQLAKGDFFQWLDADDLLQSQKLEIQIQAFLDFPELDMVYGDLRYFYDSEPNKLIFSPDFNKKWTLDKSGNSRDLIKYLLVSCVIMPSMPLMKRNVIEKVKGFDETYRYVEDWNFWLRVFLKNIQIKYISTENTYILMRLHDSSMTKSRLNMIKGFLKLRTEFETWNADLELKQINRFLKVNDEIELFLTEKSEGISSSFDLGSKNSNRKKVFEFISKFSPKLGIFLLKVMRATHKKYFYSKFK